MLDTMPRTINLNQLELTPDEYEVIQDVRRIRATGKVGTLMLTVEDTGIVFREALPPKRVRRNRSNIT